MMLLRGDTAVGWIGDLRRIEDEVEAAAQWVHILDEAWVDRIIDKAPLVKFIGLHTKALDAQPWVHIARRNRNLTQLFSVACVQKGNGPPLAYPTRNLMSGTIPASDELLDDCGP